MTMKKMIALLLVVVMSLSLAATAFADDVDVTDAAKGANVKVTGTTTVPTIKLSVPTAASVILNPYAMKVNTSTGAVDSESDVQDKVISAVSYIKNFSDVDINVGVTATGTPATGITLATKSVASVANGGKQVFLQLLMQAVDADDDEITADDATKLVLSTTATTLKAADQITLAARKAEDTLADAEGVLAFQFIGDTSKTPTTPWTAKDTVGATLAFTFTPQDAAIEESGD